MSSLSGAALEGDWESSDEMGGKSGTSVQSCNWGADCKCELAAAKDGMRWSWWSSSWAELTGGTALSRLALLGLKCSVRDGSSDWN